MFLILINKFSKRLAVKRTALPKWYISIKSTGTSPQWQMDMVIHGHILLCKLPNFSRRIPILTFRGQNGTGSNLPIPGGSLPYSTQHQQFIGFVCTMAIIYSQLGGLMTKHLWLSQQLSNLFFGYSSEGYLLQSSSCYPRASGRWALTSIYPNNEQR